jgi:hypothetical protein
MLHNNIEMLQNNSPNSPKQFLCEICNYKCCKKSDFEKHILSNKHKRNKNGDKCNIKFAKNVDLSCIICNKVYKSRTGIWRHKKICQETEINEKNCNYIKNENTILDSSSNEIKALTELVLELVKNNTELQKQNQDFQKQVLEICKNNNNNTIINNTNSNNHNKTFNLQVFLNEECKDAMNMSDFINSIQLKLSDLENIGNQGYIEGVSNIIINHLNKTDMYKRPFHCSDSKRETLYIKEENKWEKEGPDNKKMKKAVHGVEKKNFLMLNQWKEKYPKCMDSESTQSDAYMHLISKLMNGDEENINKVIKKLAKEVIIEKCK